MFSVNAVAFASFRDYYMYIGFDSYDGAICGGVQQGVDEFANLNYFKATGNFVELEKQTCTCGALSSSSLSCGTLTYSSTTLAAPTTAAI